MTVETHEIVFSFDQPGDTRNPLFMLLQQLLSRPLARESRATALLGSQRVLIIDSHQERAQYIAHLLASNGFWPFVAPTPLDAYTLFLQGTFHPFAIILSEEEVANQFFLTRLSQQFLQRYDWKIPFIRLRIAPSAHPGPRTTGPLASGRILQRPTSPLNQPGSPLRRPNISSPLPPAQRPFLSGPIEQLPQSAAPQSFRPAEIHPQTPTPPTPWQLDPTTTSPTPWQLDPTTTSPTPPRLPTEREPLVRMRSSSTQPANPTPSQQLLPPDAGPVSQVFNRSLVTGPNASLRNQKKQAEKISLNGLSIGRYQLKSLIGGNPIGDVYLTYDRLREQDIALKTIQTNMIPFHLMDGMEEDYNLFQQEMDIVQQMEHPYISKVMNIGKSYISGFPFIYKTMPYYSEGSLAGWLTQYSRQMHAAADVARVILQLAEAVQFLHNRGMLYQNFKLTNILITNSAASLHDLRVILTDLPFVKDVINLPKTSESYRYFAPEQWEHEAFTSSDQYGLAIVAYELLTGRAPFLGNSDAIMRRMHQTMAAPSPSSFNPNIHQPIDKVLLRALTKRPEERFDSVLTFARALERAANAG